MVVVFEAGFPLPLPFPFPLLPPILVLVLLFEDTLYLFYNARQEL
jgi:hypothetical protein